MKIDIAITVTQRFECLNLLLDILKNNFENDYVTHVFCNLCEDDLASHGDHIDMSLVDHFHHFPSKCFMRQDTYADSTSRELYKRIRPLGLIKNVFSTMSSKYKVENFIYTECDVFPLDENKYVQFLNASESSGKTFASYTDQSSPKSRDGFILMAPIYLPKAHARKVAAAISEHIYIPNGQCLEGRLLSIMKSSGISLSQITDNFPNFAPEYSEKNRSIDTETSHQNNILNLAKPLCESHITTGKWVQQVIDVDELHELSTGNMMLKKKDFDLRYWE